MSGKPNPDGIKELRQSFRDFTWTRERVAELKTLVTEQTKNLELREVELRGLTAIIQGKLAEMDVASPGNAGWEQRYFELLRIMSGL